MRTFLITCAVLLFAAAGIYFYKYRAPASASSSATSSSQTLSDGTVVTGLPAGATVTEVPATPQPAAPDYRAPVAYDASVSPEVRAAIEPRLAADRALLAKNSQNFDAWMDVAILRKIGGDYRGAEAVWLYATQEWPTSYVAFHNLGDLYQNFLKDPVKAKLYLDQAAKLQAQ